MLVGWPGKKIRKQKTINVFDLTKLKTLQTEGIDAEKIIITYANTLLTAINTNLEQFELPEQHPCTIDLRNYDNEELERHYGSLINSVQIHTCRVNGYCKSNNSQECRIKFPQPLKIETELSFTEKGNKVCIEICL